MTGMLEPEVSPNRALRNLEIGIMHPTHDGVLHECCTGLSREKAEEVCRKGFK